MWPITVNLSANEARVNDILARLGIPAINAESDVFAGGSMFFGRSSDVKCLLDLALPIHQFEEEGGQLDGTLAHALERIFAIAVCRAGQAVRTAGISVEPRTEHLKYVVTKDPFAVNVGPGWIKRLQRQTRSARKLMGITGRQLRGEKAK